MLLFVAYKWFKVKYLSICHTLSLCWYKNLPLWPKFCFSWYLQKGFSPIVNWPWRFCPPALLSSSNWMENNFREQQPNEDNFLSVKKRNFLIISKQFHSMSDKSVCLFLQPFSPPFAEEAVRPFSDRKLFSSFQMFTTIVYHCQVEMYVQLFVFQILKHLIWVDQTYHEKYFVCMKCFLTRVHNSKVEEETWW